MPNRLAAEPSPYLLQHAENPVDWMPWSDEAFEMARRENKPVFLSIGYSTCHWCHVMEHESFEDEEVAEALNRVFVCIKVDREERPDIDQVYMTVCQALTGSGGWPLTIIMTPDKKPFFAGTYFPKHGRLGRPGILQVIESIDRAWKNDAAGLVASSEEITRAIRELTLAPEQERTLTESTLETAYLQLARAFDPEHGGFSLRPKFPTPHNLMFLLRYARRYKSAHALEMVEKTVDAMRLGGIFDQIGFGFHRYSTDERWLVPHFEKMLYDQALMAMACTELYQYTHLPRFRQIVSEVLDYVLRDMTSPEGGFCSAEDADSEGVEGKFYVWTAKEIRAVLGPDAELFFRAFNITEQGNFLEETTGEQLGVNIPHLTRPLAELTTEFGMTEDELRKRLEHAREVLFGVREKRVHPLKDDKILTDWNGLMIAALAKAAQALNNPSCGEAARNAANFVRSKLMDSDGRLLKRYRKGQAGLTAMLDDYAFFVWGLLELYEWCFDPELLHEAVRLTDLMIEQFEDQENGGFFISPADADELPVRMKEGYDGAIPAGNSVAALNLMRLGRMAGKTEYEEAAQRVFRSLAAEAAPRPSNHAFLMLALDFATAGSSEIVIAGEQGSAETRKMLRSIWSRFLPNKVLMLKEPATAARLVAVAPFIEEQDMLHGQSTAYLCQNYTCAAPIADLAQFELLLDQI